jgi:hypothetical protein
MKYFIDHGSLSRSTRNKDEAIIDEKGNESMKEDWRTSIPLYFCKLF